MKDTLLCFIQRDTQKVTELSFLACLESTRDHQKDFEHSRSRAALRLIYAASEGRFGIVAAAVKVSSEGQWKAEAAHVQKWALIYSRARACDGGGSYRNRPQLKNTRRRPSPARMPRRRILGAKFNGRFFFRRPTSHITGNCNTLKDNLILSLIRYVVAIKS